MTEEARVPFFPLLAPLGDVGDDGEGEVGELEVGEVDSWPTLDPVILESADDTWDENCLMKCSGGKRRNHRSLIRTSNLQTTYPEQQNQV